MIFFRERSFALVLEQNGVKLRFLAHLKLSFEGDIDPQSGMVINLTEVDHLMDQVLAKRGSWAVGMLKSTPETLRAYFLDLIEEIENHQSHFIGARLAADNVALIWEKGQILFSFKAMTWVWQSDVWDRMQLEFYSSRALSSSWLSRFNSKKWSSVEKLGTALLARFPFLIKINVQGSCDHLSLQRDSTSVQSRR